MQDSGDIIINLDLNQSLLTMLNGDVKKTMLDPELKLFVQFPEAKKFKELICYMKENNKELIFSFKKNSFEFRDDKDGRLFKHFVLTSSDTKIYNYESEYGECNIGISYDSLINYIVPTAKTSINIIKEKGWKHIEIQGATLNNSEVEVDNKPFPNSYDKQANFSVKPKQMLEHIKQLKESKSIKEVSVLFTNKFMCFVLKTDSSNDCVKRFWGDETDDERHMTIEQLTDKYLDAFIRKYDFGLFKTLEKSVKLSDTNSNVEFYYNAISNLKVKITFNNYSYLDIYTIDKTK